LFEEIAMAEYPSRPNYKEFWYDRDQGVHRVEDRQLLRESALMSDPDDFSAIGGPESESAYGRSRNDVGDFPFDAHGGPYDRDVLGYEQDRGGYIKKHYADYDRERQAGPFRGVGPRTYRKSDVRLHEDVCEALTEDPELDASNIEVQVADGIVTLKGTVNSSEDRRHAEDIAAHCVGVIDVCNQLQSSDATQR
jgi:hypothetical protein